MAPELDQDLAALQEVRDHVRRAKAACEAVHGWSQAQVDRVCEAMAKAAASAAFELGKLAVEETGIGRVHYKVLKNLFGAEGTWASIKDEKTVGIISRDERLGVLEVATAAGVVAGIVPTTNPTSTAIFKALIAVKGKNAIVISPHPRARRCIGETVEVMRRAIERAGGPPDLVSSLRNPTIESTGALMKHRDVAIILATGGSGLVRAAYSSGKPAYGVGPGNVPVYVDRSADLALAAQSIVGSQSFDNATLCCSEQALVLDAPIVERFLAAMKARGAHVCDEAETAKLAKLCNKSGHMNPDVVGIDPWRIAEMAGFRVPRHTSVLLAWQEGVGPAWPLSIEILCPVLSLHRVDGWRQGCAVCIETLESDGLGHTLGVWARDEELLEAFFLEKPANRIIVNGPCSQGAVGYSTRLVPSMSLGCGPQAGNITSDNITARHLVNVKRVAFPRADWAEIERRDHARAATLGGESAPRGSGLPGDPALSIEREPAPGRAADPASNWRGNPSFPSAAASPGASASSSIGARAPGSIGASAPGSGGGPLASKVASAPKARAAPPSSFMRPSAGSQTAVLARPTPPLASATPAAGSSAPAGSLYRGAGLSAAEIQSLMANAGAGCPMGPCRGCPHNDVRTGACTA